MEVAVEFEQGMARIGVFRIVLDKFSYQEQPSPVVLLVVDEGPEIVLYCTIFLFDLNVSLGVEGGRESLFDARK